VKVIELIGKLMLFNPEEEVVAGEHDIRDVVLVDEDRQSMFGKLGDTYHVRWVEIA